MNRRTALFAAIGIAFSCGPGSNPGEATKANTADRVGAIATAASTFTVGGTISGLSGTVVLQNNAGDDLSLSADGPFTFATALADGSTYAVTVLAQPPGQTCTVANGNGTISGAGVTDVTVTCTPDSSSCSGGSGGGQGFCIYDDISGTLTGWCMDVGTCFAGPSIYCCGTPNPPIQAAFCGPTVDNTFCIF